MLLVYSISSEFSLSSFLKLASLMPPLYYKTIWSLDFGHVVSLMWTLIYLGLEYSQSSIAGIHREVRVPSYSLFKGPLAASSLASLGGNHKIHRVFLLISKPLSLS